MEALERPPVQPEESGRLLAKPGWETVIGANSGCYYRRAVLQVPGKPAATIDEGVVCDGNERESRAG